MFDLFLSFRFGSNASTRSDDFFLFYFAFSASVNSHFRAFSHAMTYSYFQTIHTARRAFFGGIEVSHACWGRDVWNLRLEKSHTWRPTSIIWMRKPCHQIRCFNCYIPEQFYSRNFYSWVVVGHAKEWKLNNSPKQYKKILRNIHETFKIFGGKIVLTNSNFYFVTDSSPCWNKNQIRFFISHLLARVISNVEAGMLNFTYMSKVLTTETVLNWLAELVESSAVSNQRWNSN